MSIVGEQSGWQHTDFAQCPQCHKLLELECRECPRCGDKISEEQARASAIVISLNAWACRSASAAKAFDSFIPINLVASLGMIVLDWAMPRIQPYMHPFSLGFVAFCSGTPVLLTLLWSWSHRLSWPRLA